MGFLRQKFIKINARTIYLFSFFTGIASGLIAIAFYKTIHLIMHYNFEDLAHLHLLQPGGQVLTPEDFQIQPAKWIIFVLPIIGGLLTGLILQFWTKDVAGGGTEEFLDAFHNHSGVLKRRTGPAKFFASIFTLGSGGSGGKEGPMTLIGAGIGSLFGRFIKLGARAQRTLMLAGAAGGLGAIFRAPLGGAITAVEVLYKEDFESDALIPCIIASVTAYTTFGAFQGYGHILKFTADTFHSPLELLFYILLALVCTGAGFLFVKIYNTIGNFFESLPLPIVAKPVLGGVVVGGMGTLFPEILGSGLGVVQQAIYGTYNAAWPVALKFFLLLALLKMLSTSFTIRSGGSAGVMVPSLFIGAMIGGAVGTILHALFPELVPSVTPFVVVGMASFFAAVTNASLGALVMVTELTGGYEMLPPLMLVCVISLIFSHRWSIYKNQVANKFFSKAHLWDMNPAILKNISIAEAFKGFQNKAIIDRKMHLCDINKLARKIHDFEFLVQDENQKLMGILTLHDLEFEEDDIDDLSGLDDLLVAEDMIHHKITSVSPKDNLLKAMKFLTNTKFSKVPVVDTSKVKSELKGYITRKDILKFYNNLGAKD